MRAINNKYNFYLPFVYIVIIAALYLYVGLTSISSLHQTNKRNESYSLRPLSSAINQSLYQAVKDLVNIRLRDGSVESLDKIVLPNLNNYEQVLIFLSLLETELTKIRVLRQKIYAESQENVDLDLAYHKIRNIYDKAYTIKLILQKTQGILSDFQPNNEKRTIADYIDKLIIRATQTHKSSPFDLLSQEQVSVLSFKYLNRFKSMEGDKNKFEISRHQIGMHRFPYLPDAISPSEAENPAFAEQRRHDHPQDEFVIALSDNLEIVFYEDTERRLPVNFGQMMCIPANVSHRVINRNNRPAPDTCLKSPLLQLVKADRMLDGVMYGNKRGHIADPILKEEKTAWGQHLIHTFDDLPSRLSLSENYDPTYVNDGHNRVIPQETAPLKVNFNILVVDEGQETPHYNFNPVYEQTQVLRIFPWPKEIPEDWDLESGRTMVRGEIIALDEKGNEIIRKTFAGGDVILLDNSFGNGKPIAKFYIKNASLDTKMILSFIEPDSSSLAENVIRNTSLDMMVFDLDGTLAKTQEPISDETLKQLCILVSQGMKVAVFSAKSRFNIKQRLRVDEIPVALRKHIYVGSTAEGDIYQLDGVHIASLKKSLDSKKSEEILFEVRALPYFKGLREVSDKSVVRKNEYSIIKRDRSIVIGHLNWLAEAEKEKLCQMISDFLEEKGYIDTLTVTMSGGTVAIDVISKKELLEELFRMRMILPERTVVCGDSLNGHGNDRSMLTMAGVVPFYLGHEKADIQFTDSNNRILSLSKKGPEGVIWLLKKFNRIIWLGSGINAPISLAGGKGAGLMELGKIDGIEVPEGFIVMTESYRQYIENNCLHNDVSLFEQLSFKLASIKADKEEGGDPDQIKRLEDALEAARITIQNKILNGVMPQAVELDIENAYKRLQELISEQRLIIVCRSSATIEDIEEASAAGQHKTVLGLDTLDGVLKGIAQVWASLFSKEAVDYRNSLIAKGLKENKYSTLENLNYPKMAMAVVVQRMIQPQSAGVAFNIDIRRKREGILIESIPGLGELLVESKITPDRWLYDSSGQELLERSIVPKNKIMLYSERKKVIEEIDVFVGRQHMPSLTQAQSEEVASSLHKISKHYSDMYRYIDSEFVIDRKGKLYFVQIRPVTEEVDIEVDPICMGVDYASAGDNEYNILDIDGEVASLGGASGRLIIIDFPDSKEPEFDNQGLAYKYVREGDILVTPTTNIGWTRLFSKLGGIVTERGGVMSHTSILARERNVPAMVGAWGICGGIKKFFKKRYIVQQEANGAVIIVDGITLDAINGLIIDRELTLKEDRLSKFIAESTKLLPHDYYSKRSEVAHYKDSNSLEWTGKPEYALSNLQFDLYERAWLKARDRIGLDQETLPIVTGVVTPYAAGKGEGKIGLITPNSGELMHKGQFKVLAVPTHILCDVGDKMRKKGFEWIFEFQKNREKAFNDFTKAVENLSFDNLNLQEVFDAYSDVISYAHLRAGFRRRVVGPLIAEAMDSLPEGIRVFISRVLTMYSTGLFMETTHLRDIEYKELLFTIEFSKAKEIFMGSSPKEAIMLLQRHHPSIYKKLYRHAFSYKLERSQNDDFRNELPLESLIITIRSDLKTGEASLPVNRQFHRTEQGYRDMIEQLNPFILAKDPQFDFKKFRKIMMLAWKIPSQVDMERNLQHRCHNKLRFVLLGIQKIFTSEGILRTDESIFNLTTEEILNLVVTQKALIAKRALQDAAYRESGAMKNPVDFSSKANHVDNDKALTLGVEDLNMPKPGLCNYQTQLQLKQRNFTINTAA